jgi:hypothetical protein
MLKLKNRAQSQSEEELELLGTVRELIGKDGLIYPSNSNNLKNVSKRMQITLQDKAGTKEVLLTMVLYLLLTQKINLCTDFDNDNLYAVTFGINEEGQFSKLAHNSQTQIENFARFESKLKAFDRIAVDANPEELATL